MTTTEKCRTLLEMIEDTKEVWSFQSLCTMFAEQYVHPALSRYILWASDPTTVQEICEAYLQTQFILDGVHVREARDIQQMKARIQDLEAANAELVELLERFNDYPRDYFDAKDWADIEHAVALAKARKVGG